MTFQQLKEFSRGITRQVVDSSATAEAGYGLASYEATAPSGPPGPNISRIKSRPSGACLYTLTRPAVTTKNKAESSPS